MKKLLFFLLRFGVSAGILYLIFTVDMDKDGQPDLSFRKMVNSISQIYQLPERRPFLYSAIFCYGVVLLFGCLRWRILLEAHSIKLGFLKIVELFFIGSFFNSFFPSLTGGDIVKAYYISKETKKRVEAVMTIIVDRGSGLLALLFLGAGAGVINLGRPGMLAPSLTILTIFLLSAIFIILAFNSKICGRVSSTVSNTHGQPRLRNRLKSIMARLYHAFYFYKSCPQALWWAFVLSFLLQSLMMLINYQVALGLGVKEVSLGYFFLFVPIAGIISSIPISIAGWGVGEMAYKKCFSYIGMPGELSVSISFLIRLIFLGWSLIGLPLYLLHRPRREK